MKPPRTMWVCRMSLQGRYTATVWNQTRRMVCKTCAFKLNKLLASCGGPVKYQRVLPGEVWSLVSPARKAKP